MAKKKIHNPASPWRLKPRDRFAAAEQELHDTIAAEQVRRFTTAERRAYAARAAQVLDEANCKHYHARWLLKGEL